MNANILIIDDELTVCRSCQKILGEDGYSISIALNGHEGLERARKEDFDLAIVDLKMPDIDGMDVVEVIKAERPDTTVIIMTGYSTVSSAVKGMKLGAADYISKPFTPDEMSMAVRKVLQQKEHEAEVENAGLLINRGTIIEVLTRAAEDKEFAAQLSDTGSDMLEEYDLNPEEKAALISVVQPSEEEAMLVVSHELKSPLASIASLAGAIQEPNVPGNTKERFLNRIVFRAKSALGMIDEYLILSKIISGKLETVPEKVNFSKAVIQNALDNQKEAISGKGMSAMVDIPSKLEVTCDPKYIQIVYNNLISNATRYGTAGTEIQLGYSGILNDYHHFNVANVGEWIRGIDRKRIFEKYVTLGKRGTGIGLHATVQIVRKHGGGIWVEPCYFVEGKCISKESIIKKADDEILTGNNFIFTIPVDKSVT